MEVGRSPKLRLAELLVVYSLVCKRHDHQFRTIWEHKAFWFEEHVSRYDVSFQHALIEQESTQRFTDYHIYSFQGYLSRGDVFDLALYDGDDLIEAIRFDELSGVCCHRAGLNCVYSFRSSLCSKER